MKEETTKHTPGPWLDKTGKGSIQMPSHELLGYYAVTDTASGGDTGIVALCPFIETNDDSKREAALTASFIASAPRLKAEHAEMLAALKEIAEGKGRYDQDAHQHAINCIEDMIEIAKNIITKVEQG